MSHEFIANLAKAKKETKQEKSQEELRSILENRLASLKSPIQEEIKKYQEALKDGIFEDQDGEAEGSGEKRKEEMQNKLNSIMEKAEEMKGKLDSKKPLAQFIEELEATYQKETITLNLDQKLQEFKDLYQKTKLDLLPDFEEKIKEIWENNLEEIQKGVEENGFNEMLLIPGDIPLSDLNTKMTDVYNATWQSDDFKQGDGFTRAKSANVDKIRIVLAHKIQNMADRPELKKTLNTKGKKVDLKNTLTLEDYLVFQRKFFEETGKHLDTDGWTWLATKSGARLVGSSWNPGLDRLGVDAAGLDGSGSGLGVRPSRSFF